MHMNVCSLKTNIDILIYKRSNEQSFPRIRINFVAFNKRPIILNLIGTMDQAVCESFISSVKNVFTVFSFCENLLINIQFSRDI